MWMILTFSSSFFFVWMTFFYIPYNRIDPIRRYMNGKGRLHVVDGCPRGTRQGSVTQHTAGTRELPLD